MIERVVDASALAHALIGKDDGAAALRETLHGAECHAPHLVDAELGHVLRKRVRTGDVTATQAHSALRAARGVIGTRYPHAGPLTELAWTWRDNLSFYDGLYVALAARLDIPLLTGDRKLSDAPGLACEVELI